VFLVKIGDPCYGTTFQTIYFDEVKAKAKLTEKMRHVDRTVYGQIWKIEEGGEPLLTMETRGFDQYSPSHR
jgi:hypothetical protein